MDAVATGQPLDHVVASTEGERLSLSHIAHEMNNLLDGSLRSVGQVRRELAKAAGLETQLVTQAHEVLVSAESALRRIGDLLAAAMINGAKTTDVLNEDQSLTSAVQRAFVLLMPLAQEHDVELVLDVEPAAGHLRAGPLGTVILNGLRNAIDACAGNRMNRRCVEVAIALNKRDELVLHVSDTGTGVPAGFQIGQCHKPGGHGIGLDVCHRVIQTLGGSLELVNVPFGAGAVLKMVIPAERMRAA